MLGKKGKIGGSAGNLSGVQMTVLVVMRLAIGWHFLYEGAAKWMTPDWSSAVFLAETKWLLSGVFHWISSTPSVLAAVDFLNVWGLILIGLGLFFGCLTRTASVFGILLLSLYYVANPPIAGLSNGMGAAGNYLVVNKVLLEIIALVVLTTVPTGRFFGLDGTIAAFRGGGKKRKKTLDAEKGAVTDATRAAEPKPVAPAPATALEAGPSDILGRRGLLKHLATFPIFGGFVYAYMKKQGWETWEVRHLEAEKERGVDATTSATLKTFEFSRLDELEGTVPKAVIGDPASRRHIRMSRLIMGGNLIGGWAHARDLIYANKLVKAYHTDQKIFDTFRLAERCGVDTVLTNPALSRVINKYWRTQKGKIQFISDCGQKGDALRGAEISVDGGASACYMQGAIADKAVQGGKFDDIAKFLDYVRGQGLPAGIGAHQLETVAGCVDAGLKPDFWVKTLHKTDYWSATPTREKDNIWCEKPRDTIDYMEKLEEPWIAFKILAAGAIKPEVGFPFAFNNGADFICVGMYDFQVVDDVNIALKALDESRDRPFRPWRAKDVHIV